MAARPKTSPQDTRYKISSIRLSNSKWQPKQGQGFLKVLPFSHERWHCASDNPQELGQKGVDRGGLFSIMNKFA